MKEELGIVDDPGERKSRFEPMDTGAAGIGIKSSLMSKCCQPSETVSPVLRYSFSLTSLMCL